jgi:hypothetical protein
MIVQHPLSPQLLMSAADGKAFTLPALPYARDALQPHISAATIDFHYGKHHAGYVNILNDIAKADAKLQGKTLDDLVTTLDAGRPFNSTHTPAVSARSKPMLLTDRLSVVLSTWLFARLYPRSFLSLCGACVRACPARVV